MMSFGIFGIIFLLTSVAVSIFMYLLPLFIAERRKVKHLLAIGLINLLLGWTFFGWVGAFVWALVDEKKAA